MPPLILSPNHSEQMLKFRKSGEEKNSVSLLVCHHRRLLVSEFFGGWHKHTDDAGCGQQAGFSGAWVSSKETPGE